MGDRGSMDVAGIGWLFNNEKATTPTRRAISCSPCRVYLPQPVYSPEHLSFRFRHSSHTSSSKAVWYIGSSLSGRSDRGFIRDLVQSEEKGKDKQGGQRYPGRLL